MIQTLATAAEYHDLNTHCNHWLKTVGIIIPSSLLLPTYINFKQPFKQKKNIYETFSTHQHFCVPSKQFLFNVKSLILFPFLRAPSTLKRFAWEKGHSIRALEDERKTGRGWQGFSTESRCCQGSLKHFIPFLQWSSNAITHFSFCFKNQPLMAKLVSWREVLDAIRKVFFFQTGILVHSFILKLMCTHHTVCERAPALRCVSVISC